MLNITSNANHHSITPTQSTVTNSSTSSCWRHLIPICIKYPFNNCLKETSHCSSTTYQQTNPWLTSISFLGSITAMQVAIPLTPLTLLTIPQINWRNSVSHYLSMLLPPGQLIIIGPPNPSAFLYYLI